MINVGINGFGRIGRFAFRALLEKGDVNVLAINDLTNAKTLAHLLKYDSIHGKFNGTVAFDDTSLIVNGKKISLYAEREPKNLPWGKIGVDVVLESTGFFTSSETASQHIQAGAKKVIISAPAKGDVKTIVLGVNDSTITEQDTIFSNASCTTNCLSPMAKVLNDNWGIETGFMTTIHAYTSDQKLHDAPHKDLRRARAGALSMIPTSTGAAVAVGLVLPELLGKLDGKAMRVPTATGSFTDLTVVLKKNATAKEVNQKFKEAAEGALKGFLEYTDDPIVSADIIGSDASCIFDSLLTISSGNVVQVGGWYDNEAGYSYRVADLIAKVG